MKKIFGKQRRILAVAIFFGVSASTALAYAEDNLQQDESNASVSDGIIISDTLRKNLNVSRQIFSTGNAFEFNSSVVRNFNLSSEITGGKYAIYIDGESFVENINIINGAGIEGDIFSARTAIDSQGYKPCLVTNLNFKTDLEYDGKIFGADNIKLNVEKGTLKFSGAANVLSVDVGLGAKLFGGTFNLNDLSTTLAKNFTDTTTGTFINHGTIGAGSPDTNLIINGNLISDGVLQKVSGGTAGMIVVNGNAHVEGSTVTTDSLLPDETETVLVAESVTGQIKNSADNPVQISGMLTATGEIVDNTITVTTHAISNDDISNGLPTLDKQEKETFGAMNCMFDKLDNEKKEEMRYLYNLKPSETKKTLSQIGSSDAAQIMSVAQQNTAIDKMLSDRISKVFAPDYIDLNIHPMNFADGDETSPEVAVKVKVPSRQENNFWLNYMKNWGTLRGGTDYHGSAIVGGYDRSLGEKWRAGVFATYGTIGYGAESSRATVYDTRLGLYAGYHNRASDVYFYLNGGQLRNSLHRGISSLGLSTNAKYKSHIIEFGGEYKYDLTPKKIWHVSPFVNFQMSHLRQSSYNEHGANIYNQHVEADSNTYFAAQAGLDLKRYYKSGMFGVRFGVKHGFTGADPALTISYEGDSANNYRLRNERDKTHFIFSVRGESEFARGWFMGGEAEIQRGDNDKDVTASVMLRRIW